MAQQESQFYVRRRAAERPEAPLLTVIVPVHNEAAVLDRFLQRTGAVLSGLGLAYEYIFVDDASRDRSAEILSGHLTAGLPGRLIGLSRNFGKEAALTAGLDHAHGDVTIIIDADLQHPPELIPEMLDAWRQGYDMVYGLRVDRSSDTVMKRGTANLFYRLFNRLAHIDMPAQAGDFRLMDRRVVDALHKLPERNRFMKGLFAWVGYPSVAIPFEQPAREDGDTKWTYWRLWNFALDGLTSFTTAPLRMWSYCGALIATAAFAYAAYQVVKVMIYGIDVPGYASVMTAILFFSGIQLLTVGIIGEYIARLFTEAKERPVYLVQDVIEGSKAETAVLEPSKADGADG